jgi:hypothetical protein
MIPAHCESHAAIECRLLGQDDQRRVLKQTFEADSRTQATADDRPAHSVDHRRPALGPRTASVILPGAHALAACWGRNARIRSLSKYRQLSSTSSPSSSGSASRVSTANILAACAGRLVNGVTATSIGSYLALSHLARDIASEALTETFNRLNSQMAESVVLRTRKEVAGLFGQLDDPLTLAELAVLYRDHPRWAVWIPAAGGEWAAARPAGSRPPAPEVPMIWVHAGTAAELGRRMSRADAGLSPPG